MTTREDFADSHDITERRRAEEILKFNSALLDNAIDSIFVVELEESKLGKTLYVNEAAAKVRGYTKEELLNMPIQKLIVPEDIALVKPRIEALLKTGSLIFETAHFKKDGSVIHFENHTSIIEYEGKKVCAGILRDITERKRAEEILKHRIDMEKLIASISTRFINLPSDEVNSGINQALRIIGKFAGVDRSYVFIFNANAIKVDNTHEWCAEGIEPQIQNLQGIPIDEELPRLAKTIKKFEIFHVPRVADLPFEANAEREHFKLQDIKSLIVVPMVCSTSLIGFLGFDSVRTEKTWLEEDIRLLKVVGEIFVNALERKRIEESLKLFSEAVEEAPNGVQIADLDGRIIYSNKAVEEIYGFSPEEFKGKHVDEMNVDPEFASKVILPIIKKTGRWTGELNARHKYRDAIPILLNASVVKDSKGKPIAMMGIITDMTEHKRMKKGLLGRERFLSSIFTSIQDGIGVIDKDMNIIRVNPTIERWYPHSAPLVGKKCYEAYHGRSERCEICPTWRTLKTGESAYEVVPKSGPEGENIGWVEVYSFPMIDTATGHLRGAIEYVRDITERKHAEMALEAAIIKAENEKNKSNAIIEAIGDGIIIQDTDYKIIYQNQIQDNLYGDHVGEYCYKAYEGRDTICEDCPVELALRDGKIHKSERSVATDKGTLHVELTGSPLIDSTGKIIAGVKVIRNITESKRIEEELRRAHDELEIRVQERTTELKQSEEKYHTLIDNIQDGVFIIQDAKIQFANESFARMAGYTVGEVIGKDFQELVAPEDLKMVTDRYYRRQAGGDVPKEYEFRVLHKDGVTRILINTNVGLITFRSRVALMGTVKDITEKKRLESQLLRAQRMESIGTLAGGIAHDLNNVLTPMMLSLQILHEKFTDEQSQRLLDILETNTQRGANLIKQVMSFARGAEGERVDLQVSDLIAEIKKILKETFPRSIEIRTDISKDLWAVSGDATQLHQVLMNLCVNARDAMPDGGTLRISAENVSIDEDYVRMNLEAKVGSYVIITIFDTGIGIPPGILSRIFEPFFTTKGFGKGTGLGLSTALGIVKGHGGFIDVYSEVGKGTIFKVYLPALKTAAIQKAKVQKYEPPEGHGELVFVVDDEARILEITRSILEKHGYKVLTANDGEEAVKLYSQNMEEIKVVLMDMMMPVMDGPASIREIRGIDPKVKVIGSSGLTEKDNLMKVADINLHAFLTKPYTSQKLLKTIHEVIRGK